MRGDAEVTRAGASARHGSLRSRGYLESNARTRWVKHFHSWAHGFRIASHSESSTTASKRIHHEVHAHRRHPPRQPPVRPGVVPERPGGTLRAATRDAFTKLVDEAIEEQVDFVVIAGDLYDGNWKDYNTGHFFVREMGRLNKAAIPVYLLYGNYDAESEMTRRLGFPPNVHVFDARKPVTHRVEALRVALHGLSFKDAATFENLAVDYPDPIVGWLNIGVLHTALEGYAAHARYAPYTQGVIHTGGQVLNINPKSVSFS